MATAPSPDSGPAATAGQAVSAPLPRRHYRLRLQDVAYVNIDHGNGGILRDLSDKGAALQAVAPLRRDQPIRMRLELHSPRLPFEATGQVRWANTMGQAGVEFLSLPQHSQGLLKDWIFTQLLHRALTALDQDSIFRGPILAAPSPGLSLSGAARAPIAVEARTAQRSDRRTSGLMRFFSSPGLARSIDGLVILAAVLLFAVVSLLLIDTAPPWPISVGLAGGVACIFASVYHWMFAGRFGSRLGAYLAKMANCDDFTATDPEPGPRFR
jgi:hypothetical protein